MEMFLLSTNDAKFHIRLMLIYVNKISNSYLEKKTNVKQPLLTTFVFLK